jgi:two-component system, sensor histidine kinase and response regulator
MLNPASPGGADVLDAGALARLRELDPSGANHLMQRVLSAFRSSVARLVPQAREACAAGDMVGVRHVAHTLKSSSASIGATALAQVCGEIESMIRLDQTETLGPRVEAMCAEIDTVLHALQRLLDEES